MSKLLEWKFDVINDSLDKLFVLVEKNEHPRMLDDLNAFVKKTGKLELEDSSFMSINDWFDYLSPETLKSLKGQCTKNVGRKSALNMRLRWRFRH